MPHLKLPALILAAVTSAASARAPAPALQCDVRKEGTVDIEDAVVRVKKKPRIEIVRYRGRDTVTGAIQTRFTVRQGSKTITELAVDIAADGSTTVTRTYGLGFKGLHELVARKAGGTTTLTADGHPVSIAALHASPPSLVFEDGAAVPKMKVKRSLRPVLRKTGKIASSVSCPGFTTNVRTPTFDMSPIRPEDCNALGFSCARNAFEQRCFACEDKCGAKLTVCTLADVAICAASVGVGCGVEAVLSFVDDDVDCAGAVMECDDLCHAVGHDCCGGNCGEACCGASDLNDVVCVGATATFNGKCCSHADACGPNCCSLAFRTTNGPGVQTVCADAAKGLCCIPGEFPCGHTCCPSAAHCADKASSLCCVGEGCGAFCCPPGQRCVSPSNDDPDLVVCQACPADKTGPICGSTCCGPNEVCGFNNECCNPNQLCGGECCDAEHCLNGTVCCKHGTACGSQCCDGIGQTCCNGQCCSGQCVPPPPAAGVCCPENRACGPTCCAPGNYCANLQTGLCIQCQAGLEPCAGSENGGPACCASSTQCCVNACCPQGTECCQQVGDSAPTCHTTCVR